MKDETPVTLLNKQINYYSSFIERLKTKNGIDQDVPQEKLDGLVLEFEAKIKEFELAIKTLDPNFVLEPARPITKGDSEGESNNKEVIQFIVSLMNLPKWV